MVMRREGKRPGTHLEVGILDDPFKIIQNADPRRSSRVEPGQRRGGEYNLVVVLQ